MILHYSLKQMLRSRLKTLLFFLLIAGSACLLSLGMNLWDRNRRAIDEFEGMFTTIGTVQQKKHELGLMEINDPANGKSIWIKNYEYGESVRDSELLFDGAEYLIPPRQRPYFGADMSYLPDFPGFVGLMKEHYFTLEFVPLEDYDGTKPVTLEVIKSYCEKYQEGDTLSFFHSEALTLEAGKHYIASFSPYYDADGDGEWEFRLYNGLASTQCNADGTKREGKYENYYIDEVTEGFFETERGKCWLAQSKAVQQYSDLLPVTAVEDTKLIMAFYEQRACVKEGREINSGEYEQGVAVCMIPGYLANQLKLKVGDSIRLPLIYASYYEQPADNFASGGNGGGFGFTLLNAEGRQYEVFDDRAYEIVGIYDVTGNSSAEHALADVEIIIPYNAVKGSWENNIVSYGPMRSANTFFEIENGAIDEFLEKWNQQEFSGELEVTFYDNGYSEFEKEIESRKMMSNIFLVSGVLLSVVILLFFSNLFIEGQKERITVERIMGLSKAECSRSVLTGLLIIAAAGIVPGSLAGWGLTAYLSTHLINNISYNTVYSITIISYAENNMEGTIAGSFVTTAISIGILGLAAALISGISMKKVLSDEPLMMLGKLEE